MATARTSEGEVLGGKRWRLERALIDAGHVWRPRARQPMSGLDCLLMLRAYLDTRDDPWGRFDGMDPQRVEDEAAWPGEPGVFWRAIVEQGYVDVDESGSLLYHDFSSFNGKAIKARLRAQKREVPEKPKGIRRYVFGALTVPRESPP